MGDAVGEPPAPVADGSASVSDDGLVVPRDVTSTVDVLLDGERVWSFSADRYGASGDGRSVPWPKLLRPHLDGVSLVELVDHGNGEIVLREEYSFGSGEGRVRFVDAGGRPKVIDKWGFIQKPMSSHGAEDLAPILDATEEVLDVLTNDCGLPAWIAFGSLLGAVREGRVIPHDNDLDVAYLSRFEEPVDVAREMFRVSRVLQRRGLRVLSKTGAFVSVIALGPNATRVPIDVYACFYVGDTLFETASVGAAVPREAVLPLGTIELEGRTFPAPADPERLLEESYGEGWRTPDPGFRYQIPRPVKRRFAGWFGTTMKNRRYWDKLYEGGYGYRISREPTPFAHWVLPQLDAGATLLDVGCGNGRDTFFFAANGVRTMGLDYSRGTMARCTTRAEKEKAEVEFRVVNLSDLRDVLVQGSLLSREQPKPRVIYGRFLLHALDDDGRRSFWRFADMLLRGGGTAYLEFRTDRDARRAHHFEPHFCSYLPPAVVQAEIEAAGGRVVEQAEGTGLSPYDGEDPYLCRMKVVWQR